MDFQYEFVQHSFCRIPNFLISIFNLPFLIHLADLCHIGFPQNLSYIGLCPFLVSGEKRQRHRHR